ncbi:Eco57I restriction-modification methylase domain-containing protein [Patescibacteria group bacterium]|nr:Eco57I restriction-modification methylase domain-containing protein [Patescibacteria group bacterium]MBU4480761.1 Eco57I restriction-modification methylase domain-containing protein [Patescibacteria group bacterium]
MSKEILQNIITNFDLQRLKRFFSEKNGKFRPSEENFGFYNTDNFSDGLKLGELALDDGALLVCAFKAKQELSERSGKKAQYELGKKILKETQSDAGIFIYYNQAGNFRFSLIYANYLGKKRDWSAFRRFTYFVSPDLTNKTFLRQIGDGDFSSLEKVKEAFSVEKVTKEFYEDIANWYFWAVQSVKFPNDNEEENSKNISVIRLITRLIFIWFMRERGLVPKDLFDSKKTVERLKDLSSNESTYYKAILQNLFFATLSTKKEEREFRSEVRGHKGINPDRGNDSVFRYRKYFKDAEKLQEYFGNIPFLNGGLFECLDDRKNGYYADGFTESKKDNQPTVPNFLFFSSEQKADLNAAYGTKNKKYKVRGLLDILSSFNFTIDENSPDDADVALDPELLGRVFENLLASFNPETSTTARKATGSYYTPREIVNYMVIESLKAYFKTHLEKIENIDEKLKNLFASGSDENPFDETQSKKIVELIESVKIVDPAVGSGAFPMGALNKLVFILGKIDKGNEFWKQAQLKAADTIPDHNLKAKTKKEIEKYFQTKKPDYWRKLYLIQKCIYGVDIQQIAVEIAKLRFFISLLVDEDKDDIQPLPNLDFKIMQGNSLLEEYEGVKLFDEKLIAGSDFDKKKLIESIKQKQLDLQKEYLDLHARNKLSKIKQTELDEELKKLDKQLKSFSKQDNKTEAVASLFDAQNEAKQKRETLKRLHKEFFETNEKREKERIKKQIEKMEWDLIEATLKEQGKISELKKLEQFKKSKTKPFFLWKLNFADVFEDGGFDIVIANPPYLKERDNKNVFERINHSTFGEKYHQGKMDFWYYFLHKAIDIVKSDGVISYITSRYWLNSSGAKKLIQRVNTELSFVNLVDIGKLKIFNAVAGQHMVAIYRKAKINDLFVYKKLENDISDINENKNTDNLTIKQLSNEHVFTKSNEIIFDSSHQDLDCVIPLGKIIDVSQGVVEATDKISNKQIKKTKNIPNIYAGDGVFVINKSELEKIKLNTNEKLVIKRYLDPNDVFKYRLDWKDKYLIYSDSLIKNKIQSDNSFSNLKNHLDKYKKFITSSNKPYGLHRPRDIRYFTNPKIIFKGMFTDNQFTYDDEDYFVGFSFSLLIQRDINYNLKYILAVLNSKFALDWFYKNGKKRGVGVDIGVEKLRTFPIKIASESVQKPFINLVDQILKKKKDNPEADTSDLEKEIDRMVYELYNLMEGEIKIVEDN